MRKIIFILLMLLPISAYAISLSEARAQDMIAENDQGYIEVVINTPEVQDLVNEVNAKRRAEYQKIAKDTDTSISEVEKVSAQKIIDSLPAGSLIKIDGKVIQK